MNLLPWTSNRKISKICHIFKNYFVGKQITEKSVTRRECCVKINNVFIPGVSQQYCNLFNKSIR